MGGSGSVAFRKWFLSRAGGAFTNYSAFREQLFSLYGRPFTRPGDFALADFAPRRRRFHAARQFYDGGFFLMWSALSRAPVFLQARGVGVFVLSQKQRFCRF